MQELFYPESIAIIGASRHKAKIGSVIFHNILKSKTQIMNTSSKSTPRPFIINYTYYYYYYDSIYILTISPIITYGTLIIIIYYGNNIIYM
jgi:hypothetical protein